MSSSSEIREKILHVGQPNLGERAVFERLVGEILDRRWLTNDGEVVKELEQRIAERLGVEHCIAVANGTIGLQIACKALDLQGEVVTTPFTFVATAHALAWEGLRPVFVDVDLRSHNIDPDRVKEAVTHETCAILGVHLWGRACDTVRLGEIGARRGIPVMYDAAHAFDCSSKEGKVANFGVCEVFSFHATKCFNSVEGGAVTTNDSALASRLRALRNFGFDESGKIGCLGINAKLSEIHAAMGIACLADLDNILATNLSHFEQYREGLSEIPGLRFHDYDDVVRSNHQYVLVEVMNGSSERDRLVEELHIQGIRVRKYFSPGCHRVPPYLERIQNPEASFPNASRLADSVVALPNGTAVTSDDVARVIQAVGRIFN